MKLSTLVLMKELWVTLTQGQQIFSVKGQMVNILGFLQATEDLFKNANIILNSAIQNIICYPALNYCSKHKGHKRQEGRMDGSSIPTTILCIDLVQLFTLCLQPRGQCLVHIRPKSIIVDSVNDG